MRLFDDALQAKLDLEAHAVEENRYGGVDVARHIKQTPIAVVTSEIISIAESFPGDNFNEEDKLTPILGHFVYLERPAAGFVCSFVCLDIGAGKVATIIFSDHRFDGNVPERSQLQIDGPEHRLAHGIMRIAADFLHHDRVDRSQRRRAARAFPQAAPISDVTVLRLRRVERRPGDAEGESRDWSHRWLVQGHWRRLPKGVVWVRQHVKGPADKPLVVKERRTLLNR